jgi:hypothetical protein
VQCIRQNPLAWFDLPRVHKQDKIFADAIAAFPTYQLALAAVQHHPELGDSIDYWNKVIVHRLKEGWNLEALMRSYASATIKRDDGLFKRAGGCDWKRFAEKVRRAQPSVLQPQGASDDRLEDLYDLFVGHDFGEETNLTDEEENFIEGSGGEDDDYYCDDDEDM